MTDRVPQPAPDLDDLPTQLPEGPVVLAGRYRVVRRLGEGGMGVVYLAEDQHLDGRRVAIKMPSALFSRNARAVSALKREAQLAMSLSHPHIVTLRGFEQTDEGVFLIMDYVEGTTLDDLLAEKHTLDELTVCRLFRHIAGAMDYAHSRKVLHRDIKPSNILIDRQGKPYLTDFGVARELRDTYTRVTGKQDTSGTLAYMSPQQVNGEEPDASQDIYSLAATMYECLTGEPPFHRGDITDQIKNKQPDPLPQDTPLSRQIMRGLGKAAKDRPGRCMDLVAETIAAERARQAEQQRQTQARIDQLWSDAKASGSAGNHGIALKALSDLLAIDPKHVKALSMQEKIRANHAGLLRNARTKAKAREFDAAIYLFTRALAGIPDLKIERELQATYDAKAAWQKRQAKIARLWSEAHDSESRGQSSAALAAISELLKLQPNHSEAKRLRHEIYTKHAAMLGQARTLLIAEKFNAAIDLFTRALVIQQDPGVERELQSARDAKAAWEKRQAAIAAERARQAEEARQRHEQIARLWAEAQSRESRGQGADAIKTLTDLLQLDPGHAEALQMRDRIRANHADLLAAARAQVKAGEYSAAVNLFTHALAIQPDPQVKQELQSALAAKSSWERCHAKIAHLWTTAQANHSQGQDRAALATVSALLVLSPTHAEALGLREKINARFDALLKKARASVETEDFAAAIELFAQALAIQPDAKVQYELESTRLAKASWDQRQAALLAEQERQREANIARLLSAAKAKELGGDCAAALVILSELLQLAPNHAEAQRLRDQIHAKQADLVNQARAKAGMQAFQAAIELMTEALAIRPDPDIERELELIRLAQSDWERHQASVSRLWLEASTSHAQGNDADALAALTRLLLLDPHHTQALQLRDQLDAHRAELLSQAREHLKAGHYDTAIDLFTQALAMASDPVVQKELEDARHRQTTSQPPPPVANEPDATPAVHRSNPLRLMTLLALLAAVIICTALVSFYVPSSSSRTGKRPSPQDSAARLIETQVNVATFTYTELLSLSPFHAEALARNDRLNASMLITQAREKMKLRDFDAAITLYVRAARAMPNNPFLNQEMAQAFDVAAKLKADYRITNSIGMKLTYIPSGTYLRGRPQGESGDGDELPQHRVRISKAFLMGTTEVTQGQWRAVMGTNPSHFKGDDDLPVEQVSWNDAVEFCRKLSQKEGKTYRLPTEAEWEYACRAGTTGMYAGTGRLDDMGWYSSNSGGKTQRVGQKQANDWGLYDMHGNVWEWCSDWYGNYPNGEVTDPPGPANGQSRVLRGGSWYNDPTYLRAANRFNTSPDFRINISIGFRVVCVSAVLPGLPE